MDAEVIFLAEAVAPSACHVGSAREVHKLGGLLKPTGRRFCGGAGREGFRDCGKNRVDLPKISHPINSSLPSIP